MADIVPLHWEDGLVARSTASSGESVLWIHGYTMDGSIWAELWEHLPGWRHLAVDLPGHGGSRSLRQDEDLSMFAAQLGEAALARGVRHLVGLSFGSLVTLEIAARFPDAFECVVLAAPTYGGAPVDPDAQRLNQALIRLFKARGAGPWMTSLWMSSPPDIFTAARNHPALWQLLERLVSRHRWSELSGDSMQRFNGLRHLPQSLARIRSDVLVPVGEQDMTAFRRAAQMLSRWLPRCRVSYMADAGHLCLLEQPVSAAALLAAHLRK